jgi:hypothetical protein
LRHGQWADSTVEAHVPPLGFALLAGLRPYQSAAESRSGSFRNVTRVNERTVLASLLKCLALVRMIGEASTRSRLNASEPRQDKVLFPFLWKIGVYPDTLPCRLTAACSRIQSPCTGFSL